MRQLSRVPLIILHPPGVPVQAQRVYQMHPGAITLQQIRRPVPPVGRLQGHLWIRTSLGQLQGQGHRIVGDTHALEHLAVLGHPHDHRPAPVQVDTHILLLMFHRGLLPSSPGWFADPECVPHTRFPAAGGAPAVRPRHRGSGHRSSLPPAPGSAPPGTRHAKAALRFFMTSAPRAFHRPAARSVWPRTNDLDALDLSARSGADRVYDTGADRSYGPRVSEGPAVLLDSFGIDGGAAGPGAHWLDRLVRRYGTPAALCERRESNV